MGDAKVTIEKEKHRKTRQRVEPCRHSSEKKTGATRGDAMITIEKEKHRKTRHRVGLAMLFI